MKNQIFNESIDTVAHDIKVYKYWVNEFKKVLSSAKYYGLSINEIKEAGDNIKKYRLTIKEKETILKLKNL